MRNVLWNTGQRRLRALWRILVVLVVFLILELGLELLLGVAFSSTLSEQLGASRAGDRTALSAAIQRLPAFNLASNFLGLVSVYVSTWLGGRLLDRRRFTSFGYHVGPSWWRDFLAGLVIGAVLMAVIFAVEWAAGWLQVTGTLYAAQGTDFGTDMLVSVLVFIMVGFREEQLFRGYLVRNGAEGLSFKAVRARAAVVIAWASFAILFGCAHLLNPNASLVSTVDLVLAGLFLGLPYILTGELALGIGLHITWNLFEGNVFGFPVSGTDAGPTLIAIRQAGPKLWTGGAFGPEAGLIGVLAIVLGSALILLWVRRTRGRIGLCTELARAPEAM